MSATYYKRPDWRKKHWGAVRAATYRRDGFACVECSWQPSRIPDEDWDGRTNAPYDSEWRNNPIVRSIRQLEMDHVIAVSSGGSNEPDNFQTLCTVCNLRKGAHQAEEGG